MIAIDLEIFIAELVDLGHSITQLKSWKLPWLPRQLLLRLLKVVIVKVEISKGVNELARLQSGDLSNHLSQERIAGDVEGHSKKDVSTALIQLTVKMIPHHLKLEQTMTRG